MSRVGGAQVPRVVVIVCDSWGIGDAPDADRYSDSGSNTLANTASKVGGLRVPNLEALGLGHLSNIRGVAARDEPGSAHGRATEISAGKDTTTGHWEMMGIKLERAFPLYPDGFPPEVIEPFEASIGRKVLGNKPASGTEIIAELGEEHLRTGSPIVYTSGDSVFQIACHKDVVPLPELYGWCVSARRILQGPYLVGRVIARPFKGGPGNFVRSPERRDFSVPPPGPTALDMLQRGGVTVLGVGKISDIFSAQGIDESSYSDSNDHGVDLTLGYMQRRGPVFIFTNLVDFDSKYGHRNDPQGYAAAVEAFDGRLPELVRALDGGVLLITGDHGCDPTTPPTDHSRERTPLLAAGLPGEHKDLGTRGCFGDLGQTACELLGVSTRGLVGAGFAYELGYARV